MHPYLGVLRFGEIERPIGTYGALVALGVLVAGFMAVRAASRDRRDIGLTFAALGCTVAGAFLGAWLTFGVVEWIRTGSPAAAWEGGGVVFFGAVPGGAAAMLLAGRWLRLDVVRVLDLSIPGLAIGHAFGRLGCFAGGCCFGRPFDGPWAVLATDPLAPAAHPAVPRHPSALYEAGGLLLLGLVFALVPARRPGDGARGLAYLGAYAGLRFLVELTRGDAVRGLALGLSTSQLIAIVALVLVFAFFASRFFVSRRRTRVAEATTTP